MIMTPGPKSRAGGIVLSGTLNKNPYCLVSRNDRPIKKKKKKKSGLHVNTTTLLFSCWLYGPATAA